MKVILSTLLCGAAAAKYDDITDGFIPLPPGHEDFPEPFPQWGKLNSTFSSILDMLGTETQNDGLPFLPCSSTPDVRMRDGTKIYTSLVIPYPCDKKRPAMLVRSPYG